jgi:hypothetical protein
MKKPIASIFIAILVVTTGAGAQDSKNQQKPRPATTATANAAPVTALPVNNPSQRVVHDATIPPSAAEQERLDRLGGQPLLWLKTMAAHHETSQSNRKIQTTGMNTSQPERTVSASNNKVAKRRKPPKKTPAKAR